MCSKTQFCFLNLRTYLIYLCCYLLIVVAAGSRVVNGLKCYCNPKECDVIRSLDCPGKGLIVLDPCNCCPICAKTVGEVCGGPGDFSGRCEPPLKCVAKLPTANALGVCMGRFISPEVKNKVLEFYKSDDVSVNLPGKKDFISVRNDDGQRQHMQKRLILCNLKELYKTFKGQYPNYCIGFSIFASLRPQHCVLAGSSGTHTICVCATHQNIKLMMLDLSFSSTSTTTSYHHILQPANCTKNERIRIKKGCEIIDKRCHCWPTLKVCRSEVNTGSGSRPIRWHFKTLEDCQINLVSLIKTELDFDEDYTIAPNLFAHKKSRRRKKFRTKEYSKYH